MAQARRSFRWRSGSRRSVNAALALLPGAARTRGAWRRGVAAGIGCDDRSCGRRFLDFGDGRLGGVVELVVGIVGSQPVGDVRLLMVNRRVDRGQSQRMRLGMLDNVLAERIVIRIAGDDGRLGGLEAHVVPSEILEIAAAHLAEALRLHRRARGALAGKESRGEGRERLCFACHLRPH